MGLIGQEILKLFAERLEAADEVDVAVAWAWSGPPLNILQRVALSKAAKGKKLVVRFIVGLDRNGTEPVALQTLTQIAELRIPSSKLHSGGIFHPKVFVFRSN